jgi:hypothetical protein
MTPWYRRLPFLAGVALIAVTNAIALGGVAWNRSGAPDSALTLSERELTARRGELGPDENSALTLRLDWRIGEASRPKRSRGYGREVDWLDADKLRELGIQAPAARSHDGDWSHERGPPADVLLVLELNGPAYRREVTHECNPDGSSRNRNDKDACDREKNRASRLFIVDGGLDRAALRSKYPDTNIYAIVRGQIGSVVVSDEYGVHTFGYIRGVTTDEIQVPTSLRGVDGQRFFQATVAFGRRLEPWIVKVN